VSAPSNGDWLQNAMARLSSHGFTISQDICYEGQTFKLVAHRSRFELTKCGNSETFFVLGEFETLNRKLMRQFCARAFRYAKASRKVPRPCGLFEAVYCFAVAVVDVLDQATAQSVQNEVPPMHYAAAEMPVVYERSHNRLCFFEKTPIWGCAYYAGFRNEIKQLLKVDQKRGEA
jgi:hypothetical protein